MVSPVAPSTASLVAWAPGLRTSGIEVLVGGRVGVDRVQHAGVVRARVALGELLVQRRGGREGHVLEIAGQADQHGAPGLGVDAGHGHAVRPQSGPVLAGVPAHQQDVVAALLGLLVAAAGEHGAHQIALRRDHARRGDQAADHRADQDQVEDGEAEPVPPGELRRAGDPPGVEEQQAPADPQGDQTELDHPQGRTEGEDRDRGAPPDQGEQADQHGGDQQPDPDPDGDPAHPAVAGGDLRRPGQQQRHAQEGQAAPQFDPLAALLRCVQGRRDVLHVLRGATGHQRPFGLTLGKKSPGRFPPVCQREAVPTAVPRRAGRG